MFSSLPDTIAIVERMPEAFASGVGLDYDALGPRGARASSAASRRGIRALLVPMALPRIAGLVPALERGARVADVGCGAGVALLEMARAFPAVALPRLRHLAPRALARRDEPRAAGVDNVEFHDAQREPLPGDAASTSSPPSTACTT
jgi:hypothetical protein